MVSSSCRETDRGPSEVEDGCMLTARCVRDDGRRAGAAVDDGQQRQSAESKLEESEYAEVSWDPTASWCCLPLDC